MKKSRIVLLLLVMIMLTSPLAAVVSANPFTQKKGQPAAMAPQSVGQHTEQGTVVPTHVNAEPGNPGILLKITMVQQKIRTKMVGWIREARTKNNIAPLLWVLGAALIYGMVHSAGPGHGKAIALSYIFCFKPGILRGLLFGNVLAFSHGLSGVGLVLAVKLVFESSVGSSLDSVTRSTQLFSYSLIALLGFFLFVRSAKEWIAPATFEDPDCRPAEPSLLTALAMGMIPCPGVVMSMLFCMSMDLTVFGILTGLAISMGMAATLSAVVIVGIYGKELVVRGSAFAGTGAAARIESGIESLAGLAVAVMGVLFLMAAF